MSNTSPSVKTEILWCTKATRCCAACLLGPPVGALVLVPGLFVYEARI